MRLALLAFILLLGLTLANAYVYRNGVRANNGRAYAPVQISQRRTNHYEWDAFVWREIGAIVLTAVLYGAVASLGRSTQLRK